MKKQFIENLCFSPKENSNNIFIKKYQNNYIIEVDFESEKFNYWNKIKSESKTTQNFSQAENWVVFECVNRLLEKWYNPEDITLEKVFPSWHGTSGRLDILVEKDWKAFLMIECKTWWSEFEKEFKNMQKNWWQLFTYFQQDRNTDYIMLYASNENLEYKNEIIRIEESYKETSNVADFYTRWNKFTKQNGIFDDWVKAYDFESKALTLNDLKDIKESDASFIFNRFLEILRHNTVSDKWNAFNKIFTLFLCKIHDEWTKLIDEELEFQWKEWIDNHITFQTRLTDLYKKWMMEFLSKEITDFSDKQISDEFWYLWEDIRIKILEKFTKIRLQKNNEFAIKEVFDDETFEDNAVVLKEVVELLQNYRVRYTKKQPFLWDFFELLLTTWLKQEAWQFFTPVPIARFICKSIPIKEVIENKIITWDSSDLLPTTIDYAAWSWHFLTESMEEIQNIINNIDTSKLRPNVKKELEKRQTTAFDWAYDYMYGIEKDYRLVKTAKVGCYLHWDGIATVIHWDWLDSFEFSKTYKEKLKKFNPQDKQENAQFDFVLSNPPYSVSAFKWNLKKENAENDFTLYNSLTDNSSEIEALFIERTSQLLKEWWIAWIVLPNTILNKNWIYIKAREIILKDFEIKWIVELWKNTFMATSIKWVILFLKKRNNFFANNLKIKTDSFFIDLQDKTLNWIEKIVSKYVSEVWEWLKFEDYVTLSQKLPNETMKNHEIFKDYQNKIKLTKKSEEDKQKELFDKIINLEKEKLFYFVLTYSQKLVLVKSWEKNIEKEFLGYEFSEREKQEWIHPINRKKSIDDCTLLYDFENLKNPERVSTYIYESFENNYSRFISEKLKDHVFRTNLSDLIIFDRYDFEKTILLEEKKKLDFNLIWWTDNLILLSDLAEIRKWTSITKSKTKKWNIPVIAWWQQPAYYHNESNREWNIITVSASWAYSGFVNYFDNPIFASDCNTISSKDEELISTKLIYEFLKSIQESIYSLQRGQAQPHVYWYDLEKIRIPKLNKEVYKKIVNEIEKLEEKAKTVVINDLQEQKKNILKKYL
jgi:type I restriction enzyme M protein